jgi:hypothetical protein
VRQCARRAAIIIVPLCVSVVVVAGCGGATPRTTAAAAKGSANFTDALNFARCMRAHGVPFPDPGLSGTHITINLANVDTSSPRYLAAGRVCAITP